MSDQHWSHMMLSRERIEQLENVNRDLRQQLADSKEREATSFYQGVCTTLAMFDPHSTEYHEAVLQHGGYHVLWEVASEYDREHLLAAAKANYGGGYEAWLSQDSGQPSKQEGESHE